MLINDGELKRGGAVRVLRVQVRAAFGQRAHGVFCVLPGRIHHGGPAATRQHRVHHSDLHPFHGSKIQGLAREGSGLRRL